MTDWDKVFMVHAWCLVHAVSVANPVGYWANYMTDYSAKKKYKWLINTKKNTQAQRIWENERYNSNDIHSFFSDAIISQADDNCSGKDEGKYRLSLALLVTIQYDEFCGGFWRVISHCLAQLRMYKFFVLEILYRLLLQGNTGIL